MRNMSIDELLVFLRVYKPFLRFFESAKRGFWIVELIVAMTILSGMMLVLTKFVWHVQLIEHDSVKRMEAIGKISAFIDTQGKKGHFSSFKSRKIGDFCFNCTVSRLGRCTCDFPRSLQNAFKRDFQRYEQTKFTVSFQSSFGVKREFCLITSPMKRGGVE